MGFFMTHSELRRSCTDAVVIETGEHIEAPVGSFLDMGGSVRAKHKIYVEVPDWDGDNNSGSNSLRQCYMTAVEEAVQSGFLSVTFPLLVPVLPDGGKTYSTVLALDTAISTLNECAQKYDIDILLAADEKDAFDIIKERTRRQPEVVKYVKDFYEPMVFYQMAPSRGSEESVSKPAPKRPERRNISSAASQILKEIDKKLPEKQRGTLFWEHLQTLIQRTGKTNAQIYKAANLDRRTFSRIRTNPNYLPAKATILALAVALHLTIEETDVLLAHAGQLLCHWECTDIVVEYFIQNKMYDINLINEVLYAYHAPLLGTIISVERMF